MHGVLYTQFGAQYTMQGAAYAKLPWHGLQLLFYYKHLLLPARWNNLRILQLRYLYLSIGGPVAKRTNSNLRNHIAARTMQKSRQTRNSQRIRYDFQAQLWCFLVSCCGLQVMDGTW